MQSLPYLILEEFHHSPTKNFTDPDNLSRKNPSVAEWLHWLVVNIPASNVIEGINGGQHQMPYGSPAPQPRTDLHRYVILMWEHQGSFVNASHQSICAAADK
ncbi:hypothetical protein ANCDUO_08953 [Ancylostoma duodenale]|uniref:Phosphatidylethanolamine-binding protein n=1 Tax=Ancylostoma duodenale TaxID=51022 RepID=A0A0C2CV42_9BILA|nr:hypothetical protein ANCDUO_08953 [Ancylostoma duodenale]